MNSSDLIELYGEYKTKYGANAFKKISALLAEAKQIHYEDFLKNPTPNRDHEQSWRAFKGKNLGKLILFILKDEVESLGLKIVAGNSLERTQVSNLGKELSQVKRNLLVDFGEFDSHLPDVDMVIYEPSSNRVLAVISSKVTLRERIAQTGYWKLKLLSDEVTEHIKVYFVTPDEDNTLAVKEPMKKGRAIVEHDLDGSYVLCESKIEESAKVKTFDKFIQDIKALLK